MLGVAVALAQAICWATTGVMLRRLSTQLDAFLLNGLRAGLSLLLTIPLIALTGHLGDYAMLSSKSVAFLLGSVIFGGVLGDGLYVISLKQLGIHRAFPISNSHPLFTVLLSALLLDEEITWAILFGMVLVIGGVYLVTRPGQPTVRDAQEALPRPQLIAGAAAAVAAAICWALTTVMLSVGLRGVNPLVANSIRVPVVLLLGLTIAARRGHLHQLREMHWETFRWVLAAGLLGWGIAASLYSLAIKLAGPAKTSIIGATAPLFAIPLTVMFLQEKPSRNTLFGTVLTIAGVICVIA